LCFSHYAFDLLELPRARICAASRARFASAGSRRLATDVAYLDQVAGRLAATACIPFPLAQSRVKMLAISAPANHHHEPSAGSPRLMTGTSLGEHVMNNFSLLAANRLTHLKVVMLALACVTLIAGVDLVHGALQQAF
jgi:hypothetical protein